MIPLIPLMLFLQDAAAIEKKIQEAPDSGYEIGVAIGTYLPFVILVIIAYLFYYFSKRRKKDEVED